MSRLTKLACAALIALTLAGGASTVTMAMPSGPCTGYPKFCDPPPPPPTGTLNGYDQVCDPPPPPPTGTLNGYDQVAETGDPSQEDVYKKGSFDSAEAETGDPSQWGVEAKRGSFDITEAEGSEEPLAAGGTSKGGDVPVVTG